jgi:hypothetical protein
MNLYNDVYQLLKDKDCVIIPDFGGFVTNYSEAKIDLRTQEFCPPTRKLAFNENLNNNDGLLADYICRSRNVSWETAGEYVSLFVNEINNSLKNGQSLTFDKLGKFTRQEGSLVFTPIEGLNLLESSFGLSSFNFPMLKPASAFIEIQKPQTLSKTKEAKANKPAKSRRSLVYTLSTAAVITGLVVVSIQFGWFDTKQENNGYANINPVEVIVGKDSNTIKASDEKIAETDNKVAVEVETVEAKQVEDNSTSKVVTLQNATVYVIAGCFSSSENADNLQKKLVAFGLPSQILPLTDGWYRVTVKGYSDSSIAYSELDSLRSTTGIEALWVMCL